eukprot:Amastigsp_a846869_228.p2 type:complete len:111 gc:universal Amastigsp_a846869_228:758-426(-)
MCSSKRCLLLFSRWRRRRTRRPWCLRSKRRPTAPSRSHTTRLRHCGGCQASRRRTQLRASVVSQTKRSGVRSSKDSSCSNDFRSARVRATSWRSHKHRRKPHSLTPRLPH